MTTGQSKAVLRYLRVAPRKVRLLVDLIRGASVQDAIVQLRFSKKHAARPVLKLLESALANAKHNHNLDEKTLVVKTAFVDGGPVLKRWQPRAFGRASMLRKRTSHVTLVLEGTELAQKAAAKKKATKKADTTDASVEEAVVEDAAPTKETKRATRTVKKPAAARGAAPKGSQGRRKAAGRKK